MSKLMICTDGLAKMEVHSEEIYCRQCGCQIPPARLKAMPKAIYCVTCQAKLEREKRA